MRRFGEMITADFLRRVLSYDPETGVFRWKEPDHGVKLGAVAGSVDRNGYRRITIKGIRRGSSRLAWLYVTGEWPAHQIDHINCVRADDRFANLRQATRSENSCNRLRNVNNTSGRKGVTWNKAVGKWQVTIGKNGESHYVGVFPTLDDAAEAYERAARAHHNEFARP